jgi:hypothetical protein
LQQRRARFLKSGEWRERRGFLNREKEQEEWGRGEADGQGQEVWWCQEGGRGGKQKVAREAKKETPGKRKRDLEEERRRGR